MNPRLVAPTLLLFGLALLAGAAGLPAQGPDGILRVVDGDTVRLGDGGSSVRLVGYDAPETGRKARCPIERDLGDQAKRHLRTLIADNPYTLTLVACSCRPGTEGTERCNFGRRCGVLTINGQDVAEIMVKAALAKPYQCSGTRCPKRGSWC